MTNTKCPNCGLVNWSTPDVCERRRRGKVESVWLMASSPTRSLFVTLCARAYCPVRKLARLGEQSGVVAKKFVKSAPSRASRSMFGVRA